MSVNAKKKAANPEFDRDWYSTTYPDVLLSGIDPEQHYRLIGYLLGRKPNAHYKGPAQDIADVKTPFLPSFEWLGEHSSTHSGPALVLSEGANPGLAFRGTLAVHVHLFHMEMLEQCRSWLQSIPVPFDLFVSIADAQFTETTRRGFADVRTVKRTFIKAFANRGRDIAPMVAGYGPQLSKYDFVAHFHSKQSGHTPGKKDWAAQLGHHLFHSKNHVIQILNLFATNNDLGLVFPVYHPSVKNQIKWGGNFQRVANVMARLSKEGSAKIKESDLVPFPAGSFFFARGEAIRPLLDGAFSWEDFEKEAGQVDGTLAHAIERMISLLTSTRGYQLQQIRAAKPHSLGRAYLQGDAYQSDYLNSLELKKSAPLPACSKPALAGLKIVIFTCSTNGYDQPLPFETVVAGARYVFFSDTLDAGNNGQWQMEPLQVGHTHPIKVARRHKAQPHHFLDADIAVWIDGNIAITDDISPLIEKVIEEKASFGVVPHPYRKNVQSEVETLVRLNVDLPTILNGQAARYKGEGFPDTELTETNFLVMDLRLEETRNALDYWWAEIDQFSRRDQVSFDYACWKAGARKIPLIKSGLSVRADYRFAYFDHGGKRHPKLGILPALSAAFKKEPFPPCASLKKTVDVVVCVHNSPDDVARCLHSLGLMRDLRTRIIVVDDGSDLPTKRIINQHIAKYPSDILIRHDVAIGYTKSANSGLRASDADYVVLLNSDTIVPENWVERLVHAGEADPQVGIVGPLSNAASWQSVPEAIDASGDFAINDLPDGMTVSEAAALCEQIPADPIYRCTVVNGFCFAIKRKVIEQIGYLDEDNFPQGYGEENDYCLRLKKIGLFCGITLSTYVFHAKSKSFTHERRRLLSEQGWTALITKYGSEALQSAVAELREHEALQLARGWFSGLTERNEPAVKPIAFYLPQFHSMQVNDENWGAGFSEWRNVVKARPRFAQHSQPRLPGELGFYDLRTAETLEAQGRLAKEYGVYGMGVYYYRFGNERLMSAPTEKILATPNIGPRFFYVWANEDWTRIWDGGTGQIIKKQDSTIETLKLVVEDLVAASADERYIRLGNRPVFMIYQLNTLQNAEEALQFIRDAVREKIGTDIVLGTTWNPQFKGEWEPLVDFVAQFPPHRTPRLSKRLLTPRQDVAGATEELADFLESYDSVVSQSLEAMDVYSKLVPGVCPDWDNSPRRSKNANILLGSDPDKFSNWTRAAAEKSVSKFSATDIPAPLLFVNAWNEWAEGAVLEPTETGGRAYLEAFRNAITA